MNGYRVRHGGLMRCCLATLDEHMVKAAKRPDEDQRLKCHYCTNWMVYKNDAWEWDGTRARRKER